MPNGLLEPTAPQPAAPMQTTGVDQTMQTTGVDQMAQPGQPAPMQQAPKQQRDYNQNPLGEADKEQFEMFTISAQKLIHSPETRDSVLGRIGVSENGPIEDIAELSVTLVDRIDQQAIKDTGQSVDDVVKIQGANIVVGQVIEIAEAAGKIPKFSDDEKAVAYSYAVQKYTDRMIANGEITREELAQYSAEAAKIASEKGDINMDKVASAAPVGAKVGTVDPSMAPTEPAAKPPVAEDPMRPSQTMSQKLAQGGLLDG